MNASAATAVTRGTGEEELSLDLAKDQQLEAFVDGLETWDLNPSDISLGKELGRGAYGTVFSATLRGQTVAVKKLNSQNIDDQKLSDFKGEVEIMSKLRHPNVLLFMGACTQPGNLMIVTELMPKGSLRDLLKDSKYTFKQRMQFAKQTAQGMAWLHTNNPKMLHRDLKTGNLLVNQHNVVKVSDFGLSLITNPEEEMKSVGTPLWMAPEVLAKEKYDEKCDVYSFGVVVWELLTMENPFKDVKTVEELKEIVITKQERPPIPDYCPRTLAKLIEKCWHQDPTERPAFTEIIPLFDIIILEAIIADKMGRKLWRKHFMNKDGLRTRVGWTEFASAFCQFFKETNVALDDIRLQCLNLLLVDGHRDEEVDMEEWAKLLQWFGPLKDFQSFLDNILDLLKKTWFHGNITSEQAEKIVMKTKQKGCFLVRFSSDPGSYAITALSQGGRLKHFRIYHKPGLDYLIGKAECKSLDDIIAKYHTELYLKTPCPGSKYEDLFSAAQQKRQAQMAAGYQVPDLLE